MLPMVNAVMVVKSRDPPFRPQEALHFTKAVEEKSFLSDASGTLPFVRTALLLDGYIAF